MPQPIFTPNRVYKRTEIHDLYGGNRQGGITPSAKFPYIFIFSGEAGQQHGYHDRWENENVFSYTGEGQVGDMKFIKGNLALREHINNSRRVFLFVADEKRSYVKFVTELELIESDFFEGEDREGNKRNAIKFFFKRAGVNLDYDWQIDTPLSIVSDELNNSNVPNVTERKGLITSRVGQGAYRKSILHRWQYKCAVTNFSNRAILIASHIVPWKDSTNKERMDVNNGILLSPVYDALFDRQLISFENNGKIILSKALLQTRYQDIGVSGNEIIKNFAKENFPYLERHRKIMLE